MEKDQNEVEPDRIETDSTEVTMSFLQDPTDVSFDAKRR